jgi:two-component system, NtrC family, nitrogen regulation response regulator NtrX
VANILVVDDEPAIRQLVSAILRDEGHTVETATNGHEALERVILAVPDLIVLDLMMPEMDGWRFLEELHLRGLRKQTRVVIVSGHFDPRTASRGERRAARLFLPKPFEPDVLVALVNDALDRDARELYEDHDRSVSLVRLLDKIDEVLPKRWGG